MGTARKEVMKAKVFYIENPTDKLKAQIKELYKLCFDDSDEYVNYFVNKKINQSLAFFVFDNEETKLLSMFFVAIRHIKIFSEIHEISFVFASATHPDFRGKGLFSNQMKFYIERAAKERVPFIFLHPADHAFYLKYGFETVDFLYKNKFSVGEYDLRALQADELLELPRIFNQFCQPFDIHQYRTSMDWSYKIEELVSDKGGIIAIADSNQIEGYMFFDGGRIIEAILNKEPAVTEEKLDGQTYLSHTPSKTIFPNAQARIVDAEAALNIFAKYQKTDCCFSLSDEIVQKNNAIFKLSNGACTKIEDKYSEIEPDFSLTINELSKYLFGAHKHDEDDKLLKYFEPRTVAIFDEY